MLTVNSNIKIPGTELKLNFIRAPGPGGQNVNKVATAVQLRFNVIHSTSLPEDVRQRLCVIAVNKITRQGDLIIKANRYRTQERNKQDALHRLQELIQRAVIKPKKRKKTKPSKASIEKRLTAKKLRSKRKTLRGGKFNEY